MPNVECEIDIIHEILSMKEYFASTEEQPIGDLVSPPSGSSLNNINFRATLFMFTFRDIQDYDCNIPNFPRDVGCHQCLVMHHT